MHLEGEEAFEDSVAYEQWLAEVFPECGGEPGIIEGFCGDTGEWCAAWCI